MGDHIFMLKTYGKTPNAFETDYGFNFVAAYKVLGFGR
jgi:hypothetical protein